MHSSRENSRKRKNDSDKRGEYPKFDKASSRMRDTLIQSCAERVADEEFGIPQWRERRIAVEVHFVLFQEEIEIIVHDRDHPV